jgi:hypothetical protein
MKTDCTAGGSIFIFNLKDLKRVYTVLPAEVVPIFIYHEFANCSDCAASIRPGLDPRPSVMLEVHVIIILSMDNLWPLRA